MYTKNPNIDTLRQIKIESDVIYIICLVIMIKRYRQKENKILNRCIKIKWVGI